MTADRAAVVFGKAQKAEGGEQRDQRDEQKDDAKVAGRDMFGAGDQRQQRGVDCDAKPARQLLHDAADARIRGSAAAAKGVPGSLAIAFSEVWAFSEVFGGDMIKENANWTTVSF